MIKPLARSLPKEGEIYVLAHDKGCTYEYRDSKFHITPNRQDGQNGNGTLPEIIEHIKHQIEKNRKTKSITVINGLCLNEHAQLNFEWELNKIGVKSIGTRVIEVKGYGTITTYSYATT